MAERLIRLADPKRAAGLFEDWQETLIWSALEGEMGCIWVAQEPFAAALCEAGDFLFLSGSAGEPQTRTLLEMWLQERSGFKILVPRDEACGALIEQVMGNAAAPGKRCAFHKGGENFDPAHLQRLQDAVPDGVRIVPVDSGLYRRSLQHEWSRDFVSQFHSAEDFASRGLGFVALYQDEMVGGASSYSRYSKGIEIQVETRSDWQRRGIASACCAALILECLRRGLYPSWDAANPASAALAEKLGYHAAGLYPVWNLSIRK